MTEPFWAKYIPNHNHGECSNNWHRHSSSSSSPPSSPESYSGNENWQAYVPPFARKYIPGSAETYGPTFSSNTGATHYGPMYCKGDLTNSIDVIGPVTVEGNINCNSVSVTGMLAVGGNVKVEKFNQVGFLNAPQNIEATNFTGVGRMITNVLSGQNISFKCDSESKSEVRDLYGQHSIKIEAREGSKGLEVASRVISEGDVVLENTRAKEVRAKNVTLSKGSVVDAVYYYGTLNVSSDSHVQHKQHSSL